MLFFALTVSACKTPELRENVAPSNEMNIGISSSYNCINPQDNGDSLTLLIDGDSILFTTIFRLNWGLEQWVWIFTPDPLNYEYVTLTETPSPHFFYAEVFPENITFNDQLDSNHRWALSYTTPLRVYKSYVGGPLFCHSLFEYPFDENRYIIFRKKKNISWLYFWVKLTSTTDPAGKSFTINVSSVNYQMDSITTGQ